MLDSSSVGGSLHTNALFSLFVVCLFHSLLYHLPSSGGRLTWELEFWHCDQRVAAISSLCDTVFCKQPTSRTFVASMVLDRNNIGHEKHSKFLEEVTYVTVCIEAT